MFIPSKWYNLYGPALYTENDAADLMTKYPRKGTHYRGRLLLSVEGDIPDKDPKSEVKNLKYEFPTKPEPNPPQKRYTLRCDILEGVDLPKRESGVVQICLGPYTLISESVEMEGHSVKWYQSLPDQFVTFPEVAKEIPDIFVWFCKGDKE